MYTYRCKVLRVVDGDTLELDVDLGFDIRRKMHVRLFGVNAPENYGRYASAEGRAARDWVETWVGEKLNIGYFIYQSKAYNQRDKYGRSLGYLQWVSPASTISILNDDIVSAGHAEYDQP